MRLPRALGRCVRQAGDWIRASCVPSCLPRSTRFIAFGFGRRQARDLARRVDKLDREHRDDRAVMLYPDFAESLEAPQLERSGAGVDGLRRLRELRGRLLLALGADDACALLADRFGFLGD